MHSLNIQQKKENTFQEFIQQMTSTNLGLITKAKTTLSRLQKTQFSVLTKSDVLISLSLLPTICRKPLSKQKL